MLLVPVQILLVLVQILLILVPVLTLLVPVLIFLVPFLILLVPVLTLLVPVLIPLLPVKVLQVLVQVLLVLVPVPMLLVPVQILLVQVLVVLVPVLTLLVPVLILPVPVHILFVLVQILLVLVEDVYGTGCLLFSCFRFVLIDPIDLIDRRLGTNLMQPDAPIGRETSSMAAPELIQNEGEEKEVQAHVEANALGADEAACVSNRNPTHPATATVPTPPLPPPPPGGDGNGGGDNGDVADGRSKRSRRIRALRKNRLIRTLSGGLRRRCDYVKIDVGDERGVGVGPGGDNADGSGGGGDEHLLPSEWWKTAVAFLYAVFNLVFTTVVITVVHERVPDKSVSPPLPDKFFDYVDRVAWAFTVTEVNGLILVGLWTVQWLMLKHRSIIARRCFFLIGTLYMYRCVTMYVTTLPVPGKHMVCAPKLYSDSSGKIWRILRLISGGGLSMTGSHLMCGDFLYSGHTVMCTLSYLFIKEYSPPWMWWYHWFCWLLSASGVICILIAHEHYSIDVIIAYYVTTHLFWWYHTMANTHALRQAPNNFLSRTWWNPIFNFLEKNVQTIVPVVFSFPLPLPSSCRQRYRIVEGPRDE